MGPRISTEEKISKSQLIVHGKVGSIGARRTKLINGDDIILSRVAVTVQESLKGASDEMIFVEIPGGTIDAGTPAELTMKTSDQVLPSNGEEVVLYLSPHDTFKDAHKLTHGSISYIKVDKSTRKAGDKSLEEIKAFANKGGRK
jgi:hypothetical protein